MFRTALSKSFLRRNCFRNHALILQHQLGFATGTKVNEVASQLEWEKLLKEAENSSGSIVAEFTAAWCPPCRMIAPILEELAIKHPDISFVKLDIDNKAVTGVVADHGVAAVPTFVSYRGKTKLGAFSGADRAQLTRMVQELSG